MATAKPQIISLRVPLSVKQRLDALQRASPIRTTRAAVAEAAIEIGLNAMEKDRDKK